MRQCACSMDIYIHTKTYACMPACIDVAICYLTLILLNSGCACVCVWVSASLSAHACLPKDWWIPVWRCSCVDKWAEPTSDTRNEITSETFKRTKTTMNGMIWFKKQTSHHLAGTDSVYFVYLFCSLGGKRLFAVHHEFHNSKEIIRICMTIPVQTFLPRMDKTCGLWGCPKIAHSPSGILGIILGMEDTEA